MKIGFTGTREGMSTRQLAILMFAGPCTDQEELRSGTWSTIRYAREVVAKLYVLPR